MKMFVVAVALSCASAGLAHAADPLRIAVLDDQAGPYSDATGPGATLATRMAVEDFGGTVLGRKVEVLAADAQNKSDVASQLAGQFIDQQGVSMIVGGAGTSTALAISAVANTKKRPFFATDATTPELTGRLCNPYTVQWTYDSDALANGTGLTLVNAGAKSWYFITVDLSGGTLLQNAMSRVVEANGGKVLGSTRLPLGTADFSSALLAAQASGAQAIGLANAGADEVNAIKQAAEFGITSRGVKLAALIGTVSDIAAVGLDTAQGLVVTEAFYWDLNDGTRDWSRRWSAQMGGRMPNALQAGYYASTLHYLQAVQAAGTDDADKVMAELKRAPLDDKLFGRVQVRADGKAVHDMHVFQVKAPKDSHGPYDLYTLLRTVPADQAYGPLAQSDCALAR